MALPPLAAGAVNVTVAWVLPRLAGMMVGAPGTVAGGGVVDPRERARGPRAWVGVARGRAGVPPVDDMQVGVEAVMGVTASSAGGVNVTVAWELPGREPMAVGAPGTVANVMLLDAADVALVPMALVAVT